MNFMDKSKKILRLLEVTESIWKYDFKTVDFLTQNLSIKKETNKFRGISPYMWVGVEESSPQYKMLLNLDVASIYKILLIQRYESLFKLIIIILIKIIININIKLIFV